MCRDEGSLLSAYNQLNACIDWLAPTDSTDGTVLAFSDQTFKTASGGDTGDTISTISPSTWCHYQCAINLKVVEFLNTDRLLLAAMVDEHARDPIEASIFQERLAVRAPSICEGTPGAGRPHTSLREGEGEREGERGGEREQERERE